MAGTGKTTIAYSFCSQLEQTGQLAASFFCSRQIPLCRKVGLIVPSIAYQLSFLCRPFRYEISGMLERDPHVYNKPVDKQFQTLIAAPLRKVKDKLREDLVIVVDALDECEDPDSVGRILSALLLEVADLPVKLLLTSRPEPQILEQMEGEQPERVRSELRLHELESSVVRSDITTYLTTELMALRLERTTLDSLVERSGVLFVYASTVVRYAKHKNPARSKERLKHILSAVPTAFAGKIYQEIDSLYGTILRATLKDKLSSAEQEEMMIALHTVICAQEPVSVNVIAGLLGIDPELVSDALQPLLSVLQVSETGLVTTLHESFPDYLFDLERSGDFCCEAGKRHAWFTRVCFNLIKNVSPPFNICQLESSYFPDAEVPDRSDRVSSSIPQHLSYACRYWQAHMELVEDPSWFVDDLFLFLTTQLLVWMEIMNLTREIYTGVGMLSKLNQWLARVRYPTETAELAHDVWRFMTAFASGATQQLTPHIYISTLSLWPTNRSVSKHWRNRFQGLPAVTGTALERRDVAALTTMSAAEAVFCVACSSDGARIASGSSGNTIHIWDAHTGRVIGQPLQGHTDSVQCISYSPDDDFIVSGSEDNTLCIWDADTGRMLGQPLKGHTAGVRSVTHSPQGRNVVSGSADSTIRIWDIRAGQLLGQPLRGHSGTVWSVAYSPDGTRIVSGSKDCTIRIWDEKSGRPIGEPLAGHTDEVNSVAYSRNGAWIVSGSDDKTVRIWDAETGRMLKEPLQGHEEPVWSVAYSPDDTHVISGSSDNTVRIWDTSTGQMLGQPLRGHTGSVYSVAFSLDGLRIISASNDHTIRIWDAHSGGQTSSQPPEGHTGAVYSVAYSPDGARTASGSGDHTICIWDACTGRMIGQPLKGHTEKINSVAYSHDGKRIVSGSDDETARIWDASSGQMLGQLLEGHTDCVWLVAFSPDGSRIVSGSDDKTICIWDAHTGQMVGQPLNGHTGAVYSVAFSPDGAHIASGSGDETICIWDANTGQMMGRPLRGHTGWVLSVAYSPSGNHIVSGSNDYTIGIWEVRTGQMVGQPLEGHTGYVRSVTYSPDGARIISGSNDGTIRIWDAYTGQMLGQPLEGHTSWVWSVAYSPDGKHIVSGSKDKSIRIWDVCALLDSGEASQGDSNSKRQLPSSSNNLVPISDDSGYSSPIYKPQTERGFPIRPNLSDPNAWTLSEDGWVVGHDLKPLLSVPPELRDTLLRYGNTCMISTKGSWSLDLSKAKFGKDWQQCYRP